MLFCKKVDVPSFANFTRKHQNRYSGTDSCEISHIFFKEQPCFWPLTIISQKCDQGIFFCANNQLCSTLHKREHVLKTSWKHVIKNSTTWWYTPWKCLEDIFARCLEDVVKTSWKRLEDALKTFWKTSQRRLKDVLKMYDQSKYIGLDQDVLKTYDQGQYVRLDQDVFWRHKTNVCWDVVIEKTFFFFFSLVS